MPRNTTTHTRAARQRGVSLVEALIAFLVTALGMLALAGMQATLRLNADIAKQRTEAVRLAQVDLEGLRDFSVLTPTPTPPPNERSFAGILDAEGTIAGVASNTTYTLTRDVLDDAATGLKTLSVTVSWPGRNQAAGEPVPSVVLHSFVAGIDPATSSLLALSANGLPHQSTGLRNPNMPLPVHDLGDGRSVYKPAPSGSVAWVFSNANGFVTSRCFVSESSTTNSLTVADLSTCTAVVGRVLAGYLRFSTDTAVVTAAMAEAPASAAMNLDMALALGAGGPYPSPGSECFDDAPVTPPAMPGGQTAVGYVCLVYPNADTLLWSGRLTAVPIGYVFGTQPGQYRLCRYSADVDRSGTTDNAEHPAVYIAVTGNLANQNFLVVRAEAACPTDVPATPNTGDLVDSSTVQHEPLPP